MTKHAKPGLLGNGTAPVKCDSTAGKFVKSLNFWTPQHIKLLVKKGWVFFISSLDPKWKNKNMQKVKFAE